MSARPSMRKCPLTWLAAALNRFTTPSPDPVNLQSEIIMIISGDWWMRKEVIQHRIDGWQSRRIQRALCVETSPPRDDVDGDTEERRGKERKGEEGGVFPPRWGKLKANWLLRTGACTVETQDKHIRQHTGGGRREGGWWCGQRSGSSSYLTSHVKLWSGWSFFFKPQLLSVCVFFSTFFHQPAVYIHRLHL